MNIILLIILAGLDALLYGYFYEQRKNKLLFLFWELKHKGRTIVPVYRLLQGLLDAGAIYLIYTYSGIVPLAGFILAWYSMAKEYLYYIFMWQWQVMLNFENDDVDTYWLERIYFSGYWLFKSGFTFKRFTVSAAIGLIILIISNLI
jgi:small-conductance mechanosensitive channel